MDQNFYDNLSRQSLEGKILSDEICRKILKINPPGLLSLVSAAYKVREKTCGREVKIHVLNNVQNGSCSQDCQYCAQSRSSSAPIEVYPFKSDEEILAEAEDAYNSGAFRYCMVFSGQGPSAQRIRHLCGLVREIKRRFPLEVCVSPGVLDEEKVTLLKAAGLDRLNHNLNTSENFYPKICSSHNFADRLNTVTLAKKHGLQVCSGVIIGMGEGADDVISVARTLGELKAESIPVNFLIPIDGIKLSKTPVLTPEYCLRVLCLFRLLNPGSEIRVAAGREIHLRGMEVLALYPANSLFLNGYLNARGESRLKTLQMIRDAGFTIVSDHRLDDLIAREEASEKISSGPEDLKTRNELRPRAGQHVVNQ